MEQLGNWIVELNRSHHTGFAILTVLTMVGLGGGIAGVIELFFALIGVRADKPGIRHKEHETSSREHNP